MTELKERMKSHVGAAKEWLGRAEQSLEQDNEIKGNLNLMLAQAELKRAQETKTAARYPFAHRSLLIHSMLAGGVVALAVFIGFSGGSREESKPLVQAVLPVKTAQQEPAASIFAAEPAEQEWLPLDKEAPPAVASPPIQAEAATPPTVSSAVAPRQDEISVSQAQKQQLMRAAGKTLRGVE